MTAAARVEWLSLTGECKFGLALTLGSLHLHHVLWYRQMHDTYIDTRITRI